MVTSRMHLRKPLCSIVAFALVYVSAVANSEPNDNESQALDSAGIAGLARKCSREKTACAKLEDQLHGKTCQDTSQAIKALGKRRRLFLLKRFSTDAARFLEFLWLVDEYRERMVRMAGKEVARWEELDYQVARNTRSTFDALADGNYGLAEGETGEFKLLAAKERAAFEALLAKIRKSKKKHRRALISLGKRIDKARADLRKKQRGREFAERIVWCVAGGRGPSPNRKTGTVAAIEALGLLK
jgi:hypothetical protein